MVGLVVLCPHGHLISHFQIDSFAGSLTGAAGAVLCAAGGRASLVLSGNRDGTVKEPRSLFPQDCSLEARQLARPRHRRLCGPDACRYVFRPMRGTTRWRLVGGLRTCTLLLLDDQACQQHGDIVGSPHSFAASTRRRHRICSSSPEDKISSMRSCRHIRRQAI